MQPRVTAILVAHSGHDGSQSTLAALEAIRSQTRQPDEVVAVSVGLSDVAASALADAAPDRLVAGRARDGFGGAVALAEAESRASAGRTDVARTDAGRMDAGRPDAGRPDVGRPDAARADAGTDDWLWLLGSDTTPEPGALAALLAAVEIAPSVAIAGAKLLRADAPDRFAGFGETMTRFGASVQLVGNELDQSQYDLRSDVLGVASAGMLVRRSVFVALGGFDRALPSVDAALDLCVRARLAGHRVIAVPAARVRVGGGPELFGRRSLAATSRARLARSAQLHRRFVYAPAATMPLHWLALLPLALVRSLVAALRRHPGAAASEWAAAFGALAAREVGPARRRLRRTRRLGWSAIAPFRVTAAEVRRRETDAPATSSAPARRRAGFFGGGGAWVTISLAVVGLVAFGRMLGAPALAGGALAPLSATVAGLWSHVGITARDVGTAAFGAADPFAAVLAVLGSITAWAPSSAIVMLYLVALPLAAYGAWWCAVRFTERAWPPAVAAIAWALAPPFLSSLAGGHLGAVVAHLLLPPLAAAILAAVRSTSAAALGSLALAAVVAGAPQLAPAIVVAIVVLAASRPRAVVRLLGMLVPAAALAAPLVLERVLGGTPLALVAEPGRAAGSAPTPTEAGWHLLLGWPSTDLGGWASLTPVPGVPAVAVVALLLLPLAIIAVLGLFLPGSPRLVAPLAIALLGFVTAVAAVHLRVATADGVAVATWPAPGLSLLWLGLLGAAVVSLDLLGMRAVLAGAVTVLGVLLAAGPLLGVATSGGLAVQPSQVAQLPALPVAEAGDNPRLGTLELRPSQEGLAVQLVRGTGTTLDEVSTVAQSGDAVGASRAGGDSPASGASRSTPQGTVTPAELADLAGNLASASGFDTAAALDARGIGFVLLAPATGPDAADIRQRAADALDANPALTPIGSTDRGLLWHYEKLSGSAPEPTVPAGLRWGVLAGQGAVVLLALLFAIPAGRRRTRSTVVENRPTAGLGEGDDE